MISSPESMTGMLPLNQPARVNADRLLFTGAIDPVSGGLADPQALIDYVRQAEAGVKYHTRDLALNLNAFYAHTTNHNAPFGPIIERTYRDIGLEFEGSFRHGPFQINVSATYANAKILADPAIRRQWATSHSLIWAALSLAPRSSTAAAASFRISTC